MMAMLIFPMDSKETSESMELSWERKKGVSQWEM
jgi:hypothetical protein